MAILKIKDENGKFIGIPSIIGPKGDPGETPDLSNYYTKEEVDEAVAGASGSIELKNVAIVKLTKDDTNKELISQIITNAYSVQTMPLIYTGYFETSYSLFKYSLSSSSTEPVAKKTSYEFAEYYINQSYKRNKKSKLNITGTWTENVFTCTTYNISSTYDVLTDGYLSTANTMDYTPTVSTHPATKGYVDLTVSNASNVTDLSSEVTLSSSLTAQGDTNRLTFKKTGNIYYLDIYYMFSDVVTAGTTIATIPTEYTSNIVNALGTINAGTETSINLGVKTTGEVFVTGETQMVAGNVMWIN